MHARLRCLRHKWLSFWHRPAAFGSVLLSYIGIFAVAATLGGAAIYNDATSTRDLCGVVVNVNQQARADFHREYEDLINLGDALEQTKDYLAETPRSEAPNLYDRIKQNLPQTEQRVISQQQRVKAQVAQIKATLPPPACKPYLKEKPSS